LQHFYKLNKDLKKNNNCSKDTSPSYGSLFPPPPPQKKVIAMFYLAIKVRIARYKI